MSMDVLKMLNLCTSNRCGECEFNEIRNSNISGFVYCMEKLMNEAADEIRRLREELNEK